MWRTSWVMSQNMTPAQLPPRLADSKQLSYASLYCPALHVTEPLRYGNTADSRLVDSKWSDARHAHSHATRVSAKSGWQQGV